MKKFLCFALFLFSVLTINAQQPYVLLVSFDGFRWDYLNRNITPTFDSIKQVGVKALSLQPSFPSKTFPNHYTIVTGMYPEHHGIISNFFKNRVTGDIYKLSSKEAVQNSQWYDGEAFWQTAEKNNIKTASYFWPGSEVDLNYRHPSYFEEYEHERDYSMRIDGVINWLRLPYDQRPHFITLYFDAADTYGHRYGPNSNELNETIKKLDKIVSEISGKLKSIEMQDSVNLIIVSDHGMTETSPDKTINIEEFINEYVYELDGDGPVVMIQPETKFKDSVYSILKRNENHYKVYKKNEMPGYYHFSEHPFIYDIIVIADVGWSLIKNSMLEKINNYFRGGNHGYDNHHLDMHGIFVATGPAIKSNYTTGTIRNIDIYPLLCRIFSITPRSTIDGEIEKIEFILK